jgi:phenylpropionate dioxygenase-like ring-hydroxylating dioxygenase large terminal subunit
MTSTREPVSISRDYYRDPGVLDEERSSVFGTSWMFVGHESEIPSAGDYVTRRLGGDPVIVSRTNENAIEVMLNSCTHRGTQVCKAAFGNSATFRCGYHGWVFGNDGRLKGVPGRRALYGPDFDLSRLGLRRARVATRHGFVFATWSHDAPSLEDYLGDFTWYFDALFGFFAGGMEVYGGMHRVNVRGNWKLHAENFCGDGYHLQIAHRTMFELGVMGAQAGQAEGFVVSHPNGHGLRAQYLVDSDVPDTVFGYDDQLLEPTLAEADPEHRKFRERTSVVHGCIFPNLVFITTAPMYFGQDAHGQTAFTQIRALTPLDEHRHEVAYWVLVPRDASKEWKARSYLFATRQHGAASYFEADDLENFRRIDAGLGAMGGQDSPYDYELGFGAQAPYTPRWDGPCRIVPQDFSEANQRNFMRRYLELMEDAK